MFVALFAKVFQDKILEQTDRIIAFLGRDEAVRVVLDEPLYEAYVLKYGATDGVGMLAEGDELGEVDLAFSIGGDGTFLQTAARMYDKGTPIVGVNCGRLGFLADVTTEELEGAIEAILAGDYRVEERSLLQVVTSDGSGDGLPYALNEVAILKQDLSSMISVETQVDGEHVHTYQSDGLIVATPTGSTAYSMSVGGPILDSQVQSVILAPVASHSLTVRPIVIPDSCVVKLKVASRSDSYLVSIDGRSQVFGVDTTLTVRKAPYTIRIVKPKGHTFFGTLRSKLMWGVDVRL